MCLWWRFGGGGEVGEGGGERFRRARRLVDDIVGGGEWMFGDSGRRGYQVQAERLIMQCHVKCNNNGG